MQRLLPKESERENENCLVPAAPSFLLRDQILMMHIISHKALRIMDCVRYMVVHAVRWRKKYACTASPLARLTLRFPGMYLPALRHIYLIGISTRDGRDGGSAASKRAHQPGKRAAAE